MRVTTIFLGVFLLSSGVVNADFLEWDRAEWRLELTGWQGVDSGDVDRESDNGVTFTFEREVPISSHWTTGLRFMPVFGYYENVTDEYIYGAGAGIPLRFYFRDAASDGFYLEGSLSVLWTAEDFAGNGSNINFISEFGGGFEFRNGVYLRLAYRHISNAGLSSENSGPNAIGFGVGYRF